MVFSSQRLTGAVPGKEFGGAQHRNSGQICANKLAPDRRSGWACLPPCPRPAAFCAISSSSPNRSTSPLRSTRSWSNPVCLRRRANSPAHSRARSKDRQACGCSGTRFPPSADTRPCRPCSCRCIHPSACALRVRPRSGRKWQGSAENFRRAAIHRARVDTLPSHPSVARETCTWAADAGERWFRTRGRQGWR